jgi:L-lactate dehydrogenase (cytochrome)
MHPNWWFNLLSTEPLVFASLASTEGTVAELINRVFDPTLSMDDLHWLPGAWSGSLVVKGVQSADDAKRVVDAGAEAVWLSNHGGRQLDRAPVPLELVPPVVDAVGDRAEVFVDTGITSGADVVAAVALGATAAMIGRAYLYGLMAGGRRGVLRAVDILAAEVLRTLQLLGVSSVDELRPSHVSFRR